MHDTLARSGRHVASLAAALAMLVLLVVSAPALGHEAHSDSDGGTGGDTPTEQEEGAEAADVPSPTPAYMVIPAAAWGAVITAGSWVLLWRRADTG